MKIVFHTSWAHNLLLIYVFAVYHVYYTGARFSVKQYDTRVVAACLAAVCPILYLSVFLSVCLLFLTGAQSIKYKFSKEH